MRILIADDDRVSLRLLDAALVRMGHEVVSVANGLDAIAVSALPDAPPLVILDWMMPGTDGLTVCRALRQRAAPYVYIIMLTSRSRNEDMIACLDAGADDFLTKPLDVVELRARLRSGERVLALQEGLLIAHETLRHQATHDPLTGLWNRAMIAEEIDRELARAERDGQSLAVVLIDIDHFKRVNDVYGHAAGDTVLRETARRLVSVPRRYDFVGRYGGEEFLLIVPNCGLREATAVAERVRRVIAGSPMRVGPIELPLTVSLGVACTSGSYDAADVLFQKADEALYHAKATGRDRAAVWPLAANQSPHGSGDVGSPSRHGENRRLSSGILLRPQLPASLRHARSGRSGGCRPAGAPRTPDRRTPRRTGSATLPTSSNGIAGGTIIVTLAVVAGAQGGAGERPAAAHR